MILKMTNFLKRTGKRLAICLAAVILTGVLPAPAVYADGVGHITLEVNQILTGGGPSDGTFSYQLKPITPSAPMPDSGDQTGYTFALAGTVAVPVGPIIFSEAGIYFYELRCVAETSHGYVADTRVYTVEVYVANGPAPLSVVYIHDGFKTDALVFNHVYGILPSDPAVMVDPPVEKTVNGSPKTASTFLFRLTAADPSYPMPYGSVYGVKTVEILGAGRADFGTWSYVKEGIYHYTVTEVNTGVNGYIYDTAVYTITDEVKAADGQLAVTRTVTDQTGNQVKILSFVNAYTSSGQSGDGPKTGDFSNPALWIVLIAGGSMLLALIIWRYRRSNKRAGSTHNSDENLKK